MKAEKPETKIVYAVIGPAAYADAAGGRRVTESVISAGADVIFGQGNGSSFGMIQAVETTKAPNGGKVWFIDVIGDKSSIDKGHLLSSVLWNMVPVYSAMVVGATLPEVCSLDDYTSGLTGAENKLASRRFIRFTVTNPGRHTIRVQAREPLNAPADPDFVLHLGGGQLIRSEQPSTCTATVPAAACFEEFTPIEPLQAGEHILEVDVELGELAKILGEELELPRIEPRGKKSISSAKERYTGIHRAGPESLRHFKRT